MQILSLGKFNNKEYENISYKLDENTNRLYYLIYRNGTIDQIEDLVVNSSSEIKDDGYIYTTIKYYSGAVLKKREELKDISSSKKDKKEKVKNKFDMELVKMIVSYVFLTLVAALGIMCLS